MFDFSNFLNLPLIFAFIIALALFIYVIADGFDLGIGIIFLFAPKSYRDSMLNSVAPFWDGNETWLILGVGVLFAAFPLAFAKILPIFYIPIMLMLFGLIFRGVAFEFYFKAKNNKERKIWSYSFAIGSIITAFFQGLMLGLFIEGFCFNGGGFHFSSFSLTVALAFLVGYSLLGLGWLIIKSEKKLQDWSYTSAVYNLIFLSFFMLIISLWMPFLNDNLSNIFFSKIFRSSIIYYFISLPILTIICFIFLSKAIGKRKEKMVFIYTIAIFTIYYIGFALIIYPYIVPYQMTFAEGAASNKSLSLIFVGVVITLPVILAYSAYSYFVFRGKSAITYD